MLDKKISLSFKKSIDPFANYLINHNITASQISITGFIIGIAAAPLIIFGFFKLAMICILLNRAADGLDGLVAYKTRPTQLGAYLDISLDFIFYSIIPLAFLFANPTNNALAAGLILYCFVLTGSSFLIFAIFAERNNISNTFYSNKAFYYSLGLIEASETIIYFIIVLLFPSAFAVVSYIFAGLCFMTVVIRFINAVKILKDADLK